MVRCTRCGAECTEGKKFCSGCGAKLPSGFQSGAAAAGKDPSPREPSPPLAAPAPDARAKRSGSISPGPDAPANVRQSVDQTGQRERAPQVSTAAHLVEQAQTKNSRKREALVSRSSNTNNRISVAVRKRPLNSNEAPLDILAVSSLNALTLLEPKKALDGTPQVEPHRFLFDEVFDETDNNDEVYSRTAAKLVDHVYDGGFCSCFAYGQTGSGKTFTMMGTGSSTEGLYVQAAKSIFSRIEKNLEVAVSFYEIYAAKLYDLLNNKDQVYAREDENQRVHIRGLSEHAVKNVPTLMALVRKGLELRSSNTTCMNDESSRSHAIMEIKLKLCTGKLIGKLTVTDLAGSERGSVGAAGDKQVQMEGAEINKSLLALKECIRALDQGKRHIPFRQSELTQVLKESFTGEYGHTVMIANVSPSLDSSVETLNTLRYAYRVKELTADESAGGAQDGSAGGAAAVRRKSSHGAGAEGGAGGRRSMSKNVIRNAQGEVITEIKEKPRCPGCGEERRNLALLEAHKESCPLVTVSCTYCPTTCKRQDIDKHLKTCSKFPVECKMCKEKIPREQLKKHQNVDCPKGETSCLFCRVKLLRENLESHKTTCEQRIVTCEECEAKVKFSLMAAHKRTCKRTKRESQSAGAGPGDASESSAPPRPSAAPVQSSPPPAPVGSDPSDPPLHVPAAGRRRGSDLAAKRASAGSAPDLQPPLTSTPPTAFEEPAASHGGGGGKGERNAPWPAQQQMPRGDPEAVTPSPPLASLKKKQSGAIAKRTGGGGAAYSTCEYRDLGCDGACSPAAHNSLLLNVVLAQQQENSELRREVGSLHLRVQELEKYNHKLRELHSTPSATLTANGQNPSKFAHINGLPDHIKNCDVPANTL